MIPIFNLFIIRIFIYLLYAFSYRLNIYFTRLIWWFLNYYCYSFHSIVFKWVCTECILNVILYVHFECYCAEICWFRQGGVCAKIYLHYYITLFFAGCGPLVICPIVFWFENSYMSVLRKSILLVYYEEENLMRIPIESVIYDRINLVCSLL